MSELLMLLLFDFMQSSTWKSFTITLVCEITSWPIVCTTVHAYLPLLSARGTNVIFVNVIHTRNRIHVSPLHCQLYACMYMYTCAHEVGLCIPVLSTGVMH